MTKETDGSAVEAGRAMVLLRLSLVGWSNMSPLFCCGFHCSRSSSSPSNKDIRLRGAGPLPTPPRSTPNVTPDIRSTVSQECTCSSPRPPLARRRRRHLSRRRRRRRRRRRQHLPQFTLECAPVIT